MHIKEQGSVTLDNQGIHRIYSHNLSIIKGGVRSEKIGATQRSRRKRKIGHCPKTFFDFFFAVKIS
jgi:hypothetical protein